MEEDADSATHSRGHWHDVNGTPDRIRQLAVAERRFGRSLAQGTEWMKGGRQAVGIRFRSSENRSKKGRSRALPETCGSRDGPCAGSSDMPLKES